MVTNLESGYDFITLYFDTARNMKDSAARLYLYFIRIKHELLELQRKNFDHNPGDVPHFHAGVDATKGPHFHIIYPRRPTEDDWKELKELCSRKLVNIHIPDNLKPEEIS